jgi:hypothetical protein
VAVPRKEHPIKRHIKVQGEANPYDPFNIFLGRLDEQCPVLRGPGGRKAAWLLGSYRFVHRISTEKRASRQCLISSRDADFAILIVGAMPGFCCVSSNKQQRRCNGCPVHSISKRNYEASSRNLSFLTFVSPAFVVSSVLQLSPAQSASRIPKPCDWLRKIRAHAGPDRATVARPDRGEPAPT